VHEPACIYVRHGRARLSVSATSFILLADVLDVCVSLSVLAYLLIQAITKIDSFMKHCCHHLQNTKFKNFIMLLRLLLSLASEKNGENYIIIQ